MDLSIRAVGFTAAIFWGALMLCIASANAAWGYGGAFLTLMDGLYPGYTHDGTIWSLIVGTLYAVVDGLVAGVIFGWLYNRIRRLCP